MTSRPIWYIGLAASLHDPAVAIVGPDGTPVFAEATERALQNKRAFLTPPDDLLRAPRLVDEICGTDAELVVAVSWSEAMLRSLTTSSLATLDGVPMRDGRLESFGWPMPDPQLMLIGFRNAVSQAGLGLSNGSRRRRLTWRRYDHHRSHAAAGVLTSPFDECAVAVVDGYGEGRSTSCFRYSRRTGLSAIDGWVFDGPTEQRQAISLGHFYARLCALCGFDPLGGEEWKVMGLAAYGRVDPDLYDLMRSTIAVRGVGLAAALPDADAAARIEALKAKARPAGAPAEAAADLAATGQRVFEDVVADLLHALHRRASDDRLVLAGGCALNSSCNGTLVARTPFTALHVPSAPADDGCALGAAWLAFLEDHPDATVPPVAASPYLGTDVDADAVAQLTRFGGLDAIALDLPSLVDRTAQLLADGAIVGWMRGRAEFGPRALGHRSILADPRRADMKDRLNAVVKFREEFRPFAPAILDEFGAEYFEDYQTSRYMERTLRFRPERASRVPAVVHVDGTGRLQSVRREWTPDFYDLIAAFHGRSGVPLLLNTSLNVMGRPIVHSVQDALGVYFLSGLDALVVDRVLLLKERRP